MKTKSLGSIFLVILIVLFYSINPLIAQKKIKESDLAPKYRNWLNMVAYLIYPEEKNTFLQLQNDFERDKFIEAFWKQRDPTPETPLNEFKEEIIKRFETVNKEFGRDTPRPGWMTDRGRIYMILGPPNSRETFNQPDLYPCELWTYYGDVDKGLPRYFGLIFFRRGGSGEFKLYHPMTDGPKSLIIQFNSLGINTDNYESVFQFIDERAPTLAPYTISIVPQDFSIGYEPSPFSETQLKQILDSPKKNVNPAYATHFLAYKGVVSTEYLSNFVDSQGCVYILRDPIEKFPVLHYAIVPKSISLNFFQDTNQYYCNFSVDISLKKGEAFIYQASKDFSYYVPEGKAKQLTSGGLAIQDNFPVLEGKYHLTILLRNSIAKEFSILERDIIVDQSGSPRLGPVITGFKEETIPDDSWMAFKVLEKRILVDPSNTFSSDDQIIFACQLENLSKDMLENDQLKITVKGLSENNNSKKEITIPLNNLPLQQILNVYSSLSASELMPDYYESIIELLGKNQEIIDQKKATFIVSSNKDIPRPTILSKTLSRQYLPFRYLELADQAEKANELVKAETYFAKALSLAPSNPDINAYYCGFLMRTKQFSKVLDYIENVKTDKSLLFDYYLIKGKALKELGKYQEAIPLLLEGNNIYNSDIRLLNTLGYCFKATGEKSKALEALESSLKLKPDQEEVKKLIEEIKKGK